MIGEHHKAGKEHAHQPPQERGAAFQPAGQRKPVGKQERHQRAQEKVRYIQDKEIPAKHKGISIIKDRNQQSAN